MAANVEIVVNAHDNFSSVLGNFGNIVTGISSLVNLAGDAFRTFSGLAMEGIEAIAGYERMAASLQSLVASQLLMNGAASDMASAMEVAGVQAESLLQWVQELAINSPFTAEGVALALRQAMAYGFTAEEAQRLTEAMINFAAGTGASESAMSQIALALGQIEAKGHLAGQEVLQLVNAGLAVDQILAEAFGVTTAEIVRMREEGLIPADEAIRALTEYMETNFAGAAQNQATTWAGLMGTFQDLKDMGLREFFGGMADVIQPLAVNFSMWLQDEGMTKLREMGDRLGEILESFLDIGTIVFLLATGDMDTLLDMFHQMGAEGIPGMRELSDTMVGLEDLDLSTSIGILLELFRQQTGIDLTGAFTTIQRFFETAETEGWGSAISDLFRSIDISGILQDLTDRAGDFLSNIDWTPIAEVGSSIIINSIELALRGLDAVVSRVDWTPLGVALRGALDEIMEGLFTSFSESDISYRIDNWLNDMGYRFRTFNWIGVGADIISGVVTGIFGSIGLLLSAASISFGMLLQNVKAFFGIASASTVFATIGRDIVQGLINGFDTAWETLMTIARGALDDFFDLFGIDLSSVLGGSSASGLGTAGGGTAPTDGGTTTGGQVVNNFYGTVNFGDMGQLGYDCPSPHPLVASSGNQLVTSGF